MPFLRIFCCAALVFHLCAGAAAFAETADTKPVSAERFNRLVSIMKRMNDRIDELEGEAQIQKQAGVSNPQGAATRGELERLRQKVASLEAQLKAGAPAKGAAAAEGPVNLEDMDSGPAKAIAGLGNGNAQPLLKIFFDLNLYSMPGGTAQGSGFTFDNFHSFVLLDVNPDPDISFSTIIETTPHFYELDYKLSQRLTMRMGKIWIPFDDLNPHNIFGGMTNVSRIYVGDPFLPDLFADLGIGLRMKFFDSSDFSLVGDAYVVNGFQSGGTDPVTAGSAYPNFGTLPTGADNNREKSYGGRAHALIGNVFGLGGSVYTGRWTNKDDASKSLLAIGVDSQIVLGGTSLRAGIASMNVKLPPTSPNDSYSRGGSYAELGQKFGPSSQWQFLVRGGLLNLDDRVVDRNDKEVVGAKLIWKPNLLEYSIETSKDIKKLAAKANTSFTNLRVVASF
ncbi:MAG: hypothetical protein ACXWSC_05520 [Bdellovibrionota bacterium]